MKMNNTFLTIATFLSVLIITSFASASLSFQGTPGVLTEANNETSILLKNTGSSNITLNTLSIDSIVSGSDIVSFSVSPSTPFNITPNQERSIKVNLDSADTLSFGEYKTDLFAQGSNSTGSTFNSTSQVVFRQTFCEAGEIGDLEVVNVDVENEGEGDDFEWQLLDELIIEVEIENDGNEDIDDVIAELAIFDSSGKDITRDLDFLNTDEEEIDLSDIDEGEEATATFRFKVPADFEEDDLRLAVKAYGDDQGEELQCATNTDDFDDDFYQDVSIEREDDEENFITFDDVFTSPEEATCGETARVDLEIVNIGDDDLDGPIRVNLVSQSLGIDLSQEMRQDLDMGDAEPFSFVFTIPEDAEDKIHTLTLTSDFDYSERADNYGERSEIEESIPLTVIGCEPQQPEEIASITASLDSEAQAGSEMVVRGTITNLQSNSDTLVVSASGYESWASLQSISDRILDLQAGQSQEVEFTFDVNEEVSGEQSFMIEARNAETSETQQVIVNIVESPSFFNSLGLEDGETTLIWIIGAINIVLILLIIIVAVRISRRR